MIYEFKGIRPNIAKSAFIAPSAEVIGDVKIGENTSIWFQTLIRGDVNYIRIGDNCNIQDMSLIHVARDVYPVNIGNNVSLGHRVTIHGATLKDFSFVGMGATVMDDVELGEYAFVGAGSLVTTGKKIPAEIIRDINEKEREIITRTATNYQKYKHNYLNQETFKLLQ